MNMLMIKLLFPQVKNPKSTTPSKILLFFPYTLQSFLQTPQNPSSHSKIHSNHHFQTKNLMGSKSKSSSSGGKCFPPGFRFHPTDEELVLYYLKRKICRRSLKLDIIGEIDLYKWDPEDLPGQSKLKTGDRQWFFFSPRDRRYPNGGRSSRATTNGYWKATGKDRIIKRKSSSVGVKKTLVYYRGRAPSGLRTDWVMHEYTMDEEELKRCTIDQERYVLYKVFKKSGPGPKNGEQYGAPFVEEEWNDEDCLDIDSLLVQKLDPAPVTGFENTNTRGKEERTGFSNDIEEFLNRVINDPGLLPEPEILEQNDNCSLEGSLGQLEKDFLEMDDLIGPETGVCNPATDFGSLPEFNFESEGAYNMHNFEYWPELENSGLASGAVNHDYELQDEAPLSFDLWNHYDKAHNGIMSMQPVEEPVSTTSSGVVTEENLTKTEYNSNQRPENTKDDTDSWFSSALWDFVDSIPTTPASASESSALVNRAFEKMSSFSRGKYVNSDPTTASGTITRRLEKPKPGTIVRRLEKPKPDTIVRRLEKPKPKPKPGSSSRGIVFYSVLGVLVAMLWVFVGSSIELLNRFVWL